MTEPGTRTTIEWRVVGRAHDGEVVAADWLVKGRDPDDFELQSDYNHMTTPLSPDERAEEQEETGVMPPEYEYVEVWYERRTVTTETTISDPERVDGTWTKP